MSFRWSFSTDKLFRRCQRQFYFREIAAHHSPKEPWRRKAFVLKQLKTLELWRGSVTGAVEVPKHYSYGIRLAESGMNGPQNPVLGAWETFTDSEGIVCTTGWPFNIPGTVEPLVVRVVRGNLNLAWVLEDTFCLSQLCWPVPTACMRLPIDLKLCDEHLRAFAGRADEDNALFGGTLENDEEPLLTAAR